MIKERLLFELLESQYVEWVKLPAPYTPDNAGEIDSFRLN